MPPGYAALEESTGQMLVGSEDEIRPVQLIADALAMSLTQLESLVVRFGDWKLPFFRLAEVSQTRKNALLAFRSLEKLHLDLDIGDEELHREHPTLQQIDDFCGLLNSTLGCEDLSLQIRAEDWAIEAPESFQKMVTGIHRSLRISFPELVDLDLQGIDIPLQAVLGVLPLLKKLESFHFHAITTHSPSWRDTFSYTETDDGAETGPRHIPRKDLEAFTVQCRGCLTVEIAMCTLVECAKGKQVWADMLESVSGA